MIYPKPYSICLRGTINPKLTNPTRLRLHVHPRHGSEGNEIKPRPFSSLSMVLELLPGWFQEFSGVFRGFRV